MRCIRQVIFISLFIGAFPLLQNCKPKDPPKPPPAELTPLLPELRERFCFKPGTWWVYEDSLTGTLDTVTVEDFYIDTNRFHDINGNVNGIYEGFLLTTYSRYYQCVYKYEYIGEFSPNYVSRLVQLIKEKPGEFGGRSIALFYPFNVGAKRYPGDPGTYVEITGNFDSLTMNGTTYFECISVYDDKCESEPDLPRTYLTFARDVGLIAKRIDYPIKPALNKNWKLISSVIIK